MSDKEMALATHVTWRGKRLHYVRRVPDDVRSAFGAERIQRSLKTADPIVARRLALRLDEQYEQQFDDIRRRNGGSQNVVATETWSSNDWAKLYEWFTAVRVEEDTRSLAAHAIGGDLTRRDPRRPDDGAFKAELEIYQLCEKASPTEYWAKRGAFVSIILGRIGIRLRESDSNFPMRVSSLQKADFAATQLIMDRHRGTSRTFTSPDQIAGPWATVRHEAAPPQQAHVSVADNVLPPAPPPPSQKERVASTVVKIGNCHDYLLDTINNEWRKQRARNKKSLSERTVGERENAITAFSEFTGIRDIAEIERKHLISFRNHLANETHYSNATVNKKVSVIATLLTFASQQGLIEPVPTTNIHLDIPADEDQRQAFSNSDLNRLFGHEIFTQLKFDSQDKACGILQYWLPLISVTQGMISSEIMQLGPETVGPHPDQGDILCFNVTNAGQRTTKTHARKRYAPISAKLIELGILDILADAKRNNRRTLWPIVDEVGHNRASQMFSSWFSPFLRRSIGITDKDKQLYSCRHSFLDLLGKAGADTESRVRLMGHTIGGTTDRYGVKRAPVEVPIRHLANCIAQMDVSFLNNVQTFNFNKITWSELKKTGRKRKN